jgi:hypothetical protein
MQIIRFLAFLLSDVGYAAHARSLSDVPHLSEFFAIFKNDDNYLRRRKRWSIYGL